MKQLYLGRTKSDGEYELGTKKRAWGYFGFSLSYLIWSFCPKPFEEYTGVHLEAGEIRKVKSITIKLD